MSELEQSVVRSNQGVPLGAGSGSGVTALTKAVMLLIGLPVVKGRIPSYDGQEWNVEVLLTMGGFQDKTKKKKLNSVNTKFVANALCMSLI